MSGKAIAPPEQPGRPRGISRCARAPSSADANAAARYRHGMGWDVAATPNGIALALGHGMVAVAVPLAHGEAVLRTLRSRDTVGPVLALRAGTPCWLFLAEPNGLVVSSEDLPSHISVLSCPSRIPLPRTSRSSVEWIVAPDVRNRWLPTLDAVVSAVRTVQAERAPR